ncbi:class I SAM-dependent methyltransferase [Embleya scabrispora]|uniref:class I SAM-dependent methyltransferase n=1 Tax=Embleya scabrispora TaxID=159449 RepID=UPI000373A697|nr:class I SAM-dependent methyltransferase [Embleya scabrispora]MYS80169.1 hypothetical protein [Streptomyces sp. SID5474]
MAPGRPPDLRLTAATPAPAALTAAGALRATRAHCDAHCFPYHATWRAFRRTGLKGHPGRHAGFYRSALERTGHIRRPRLHVLICGASDEAMPATLADLLGGDRLQIHLIDRCPTPLHLADTYAARTGLDLTTSRAAAPDLPAWPDPFDIVVTDGPLSLLPAPMVPATISALADAVAEDGVLLYTARVTRPPRTTLEYDRPGRWIQAAAMWTAWPAPASERRARATAVLHRPSRTSPFTAPADVTAAFACAFADTRTWIAERVPLENSSWLVRCWSGGVSRCVRQPGGTH